MKIKMSIPDNFAQCVSTVKSKLIASVPGISVCLIIAAAAQFLAEHYGAPQMLFALLLGIAMHFLMETEKTAIGIGTASKTVLRIGVALLGFRITIDQIANLGLGTVIWVSAGVFLTICFGAILSKIAGSGGKFGVLSGGAVAICGASAAMAISAVLPNDKEHERNTIFVVLTVTALSTIAMVVYPIISGALDLSDIHAGIFLGGTIHDVAQVVGAGYSISEQTGDTSTIIKLFRVALLLPCVLAIGLIFTWVVQARNRDGKKARPPFPWFLVAFCLFVGLNSYDLVPAPIHEPLIDLSRWCLVTAIAALGIKTSIKSLLEAGMKPLGIVVAETAFIACWVLVGILILVP